MRETDCANTEGLFRIIQSFPPPKAEPIKRWLARVGYERVKEIENPDLASARKLYQAKGLGEMKTGHNLRDHMSDLELIFTMLGETSTTEIPRRSDALGFVENRQSTKQGGTIAGNARKALEAKTGKKVASKASYLSTAPTPGLLDALFKQAPLGAGRRCRCVQVHSQRQIAPYKLKAKGVCVGSG